MKHGGHIDLQQNVLKNVTLQEYADFPQNPKVGSFGIINKRVMVCLNLDNNPLWLPLTQELNTHIHDQSEASDTWVIEHNLGSSVVLVQIFDDNNNVLHADEIDCSLKDTTVITFTTPIVGKAVIMMGNFTGTPKPDIQYTQSYTANATWTVNHGLGYFPAIRCIVDGYEIQPASIQHVSTTQAIVTWTNPQAGKVVAI